VQDIHVQCAIDCYDTGVTPPEIYNINQLQAMWLTDATWQEVDTMIIQHCWHKASILPAVEPPTPVEPIILVLLLLIAGHNNDCNQIDHIRNAKKQVESALNELMSTGVLQQGNRMDIEALLNPVDESHVVDEVMDEEIFHAVIDAWNAQEDGPINGGDDDIYDDTFIEACPTQCKVLQAATVISQYVDNWMLFTQQFVTQPHDLQIMPKFVDMHCINKIAS